MGKNMSICLMESHLPYEIALIGNMGPRGVGGVTLYIYATVHPL